MAKGFTVKANTPKVKKKEEWDIAAIKQRMKGKTIVFCLPGRGCSYIFLKNFVQLCFDMVQNGMSIQISQDYSSMVNFARCKCLGANVLRGPKQIPWDGKLLYDYQLWIDSDIVFGSYVILLFLLKVKRDVLLLVGMLQKMVRLHLSLTG